MSFVKKVVDDSMDIWNQCLNHPFLQEMATGTLPEEKMKVYMIQDSLYLRDYARMYAAAIYNSHTIHDIQLYYMLLGFVTEGESVTRLNYLKKFGLTDEDIDKMSPLPENKAYTSHMLKYAEKGEIPEILMAVLPCLFSYVYIFRKLVETIPDIEKSKYIDIIHDYSIDDYVKTCEDFGKFTEEKCKGLSEERKSELLKIFRISSECELNFWEMAYKDYKN